MAEAAPRRLPPLVWLKAFESAGRLGSFRAAADELHVTASAISHHVRSLEHRLGRPLFERTGNSVRLTAEGAAYLGRLSMGFAQLAGAADALDDSGSPRRLTLGAFPFLVSEVLMPGLAELRCRLPGLALSVVSGTGLSLLSHADPARRVDAVIRYGNGRFPACHARKLTDVSLVPVAAPSWVGRGADALARVCDGPRITVAGPFAGWQVWAAGAGVTLSPQAETLEFDSYLAAMHAAEQGLGAGLGIRPFIDHWLYAGRVRMLVDRAQAVETEASYLVTAQHAAHRPELDVLAEWLMSRLTGESA